MVINEQDRYSIKNKVKDIDNDNDREEDGDIEEKNIDSVWEIIKMMGYTIIQPNWLKFMIGVYLQRMGNTFFEQSMILNLLEKPGFDKEIFAKVDTAFFPIGFAIMFSITF